MGIVKRSAIAEFGRSAVAPGSTRWGRTGADGREEGMAVAGWVRRLFEGRGLAVPDRKLHWLGVHLDRFLGWCRKQGPPADLNALAGSYLRWQAQLHPPPPEWQLAQIRQGVARTRGNSRGALATSAGGSAVSP